MDLRDQFAVGILAAIVPIGTLKNAKGEALLAYQYADAAVEARGTARRELTPDERVVASLAVDTELTRREHRALVLEQEVARLRVAVEALQACLSARVALEKTDPAYTTREGILRRGLEWYATPANWDRGGSKRSDAECDQGDYAREYLRIAAEGTS